MYYEGGKESSIRGVRSSAHPVRRHRVDGRPRRQPRVGVEDAQFRERLLERRPLRSVRHHDPQPVHGVQAVLLASFLPVKPFGHSGKRSDQECNGTVTEKDDECAKRTTANRQKELVPSTLNQTA